MIKRFPDDLDLLAPHLEPVSGGKGRRSDLFRWLSNRAGPFEKLLTEVRPSWKSVAAGLAALGVTDAEGKAPSPQTVRQTWYKAKAAASLSKPRTRAARPPALPPPPVRPPLPVTHPTGPPEPVADDDPLAAIRREMNKRSGR